MQDTNILEAEQKLENIFIPQQARLTLDKKLIFNNNNGFAQALADGIFMIEMPKNIDLSSGDKFAENFYKPKLNNSNEPLNCYRGYDQYTPNQFDSPYEGYYHRDVDQTEQFFLEKRFWSNLYPAELVVLAEQMNEFALAVLKNILQFLEIPENLWNKATGGCINNIGSHHLNFNHYRPEKDARGLNAHKDTGWVTVLRSSGPGLEVFINNTWQTVDPIEGYFIINLGYSLETLAKKLDRKVFAVIHRVKKQVKTNENLPDRFSYAAFTDNSINETISPGLFTFHPQEGLVFAASFSEFLADIMNEIYS